MKKYKCLAALMSVLLLSGCNASENAETASETVQSEEISTTTSDFVLEQTTFSESVQSETTTQAATAANLETPTNNSEQTNASVTIQQTEDTSLDIPEEDIVENVDNGSEFESELGAATIYKDKITKEYFIILNVTPQKVYWNEADGYDVTVGQAMDIAVPAVFEDWLADADGMMIYMGDGWNELRDLKFDDRTVKGMYCRQYFDRDYLCPINDNILNFGELTDKINSFFSRVSDGVYIEEANYQYSDNPFEDGMSVENLDKYFETVKADSFALKEEMAAHPDTLYEIAGFWGYQDGVRFRATINYIY